MPIHVSSLEHCGVSAESIEVSWDGGQFVLIVATKGLVACGVVDPAVMNHFGAAVAVALISVGVVFLLTSAVGVLRLPTFYARAHAVGKSETVGAIFVIAGVAVEHGWTPGTPEVVLILVFALVANPTAVHALARAERLLDEAERAGEEPR
jgi:multicomponent Na+:H+ antiporter subunit G